MGRVLLVVVLATSCVGDGGRVRRAPPGDTEAVDTEQTDTDTGPCPGDMVAVDDWCIDRYEAPNRAGALPLVMYTFTEAAAWCASRGRRLCFDDEWRYACEGPGSHAYPYGDAHQPGRCNDEEAWLLYDQDLLDLWPSAASSEQVESLEELLAGAAAISPAGAGHVEDLYQGEGGGDNAGCGGHFEVYDLTGNVEEWTRRRDGGEQYFHGALKGRYWAETRTCQSRITSHGDAFRFYEIGFRCCLDQVP